MGELRHVTLWQAWYTVSMQTLIHIFVPVSFAAVALVLCMGLWNMTRGTSPNLSQKLMRWRVGLQFVVLVIAMVLVYLAKA